jgi:hypothetical protein
MTVLANLALGLPVIGFITFIISLRRVGEAGVKVHRLRDDGRNAEPRLPRCACYETDGGPYGLPHWVNGHNCEMYFLSKGCWPAWCRGPRG